MKRTTLEAYSSPAEALRALLDAFGWSQEQLAAITGRSRQTIIQLMNGKARITPEMAVVVGAATGTDPVEWLRLEATRRLAEVSTTTTDVARRAKIYSKLPIKEIQRRGWITSDSDLGVLEADIKRFLRVHSLDEDPPFVGATRRSGDGAPLTPSQMAWCARARELADAVPVRRFDESRMAHAERELRVLAAYPKEAKNVTKVLAKYGVRFVVVEPLPGGKIDGAAFWLDQRSPVIAVSVRYDRVDAFWFTVMHECSHIRHRDGLTVDADVVLLNGAPRAANTTEERANRDAATALIPPGEIDSFVRRVAPLYSRTRVVQLAHRLKIHPGIIVGQLQHRGEVGYGALRDLLAKVRDIVTETAVTDGWGRSITPGLLS